MLPNKPDLLSLTPSTPCTTLQLLSQFNLFLLSSLFPHICSDCLALCLALLCADSKTSSTPLSLPESQCIKWQ